MTIRIEFLKSKSEYFQNILRICKKIKTFKVAEEEGLTVYSVEFDTATDYDSYQTLRGFCGSWKATTYYLDGKLVSRDKILNVENEIEKRNQYRCPHCRGHMVKPVEAEVI